MPELDVLHRHFTDNEGVRGVLKSGVPHDRLTAALLSLGHWASKQARLQIETLRVPSAWNVADLPSRLWDPSHFQLGKDGGRIFSVNRPWSLVP